VKGADSPLPAPARAGFVLQTESEAVEDDEQEEQAEK
jgi:hypothetical protein